MPKLVLYLATILLLTCCRRNIDTDISAEIYLPVIQTKLGISDLMNDSLFSSDSAGNLSLSFTQNLVEFNIGDLVELPTKSIDRSFTVDSLNLSDNEIIYPITLGEIARRTGGLTGFILLAGHGFEEVIPAIDDISAGQVDVDANDFFEFAVLEAGQMKVSIDNGLPIPLENVAYRFQNRGDQAIIAEGTFPVIDAHSFKMDSFDLEGKTIEGDLQVILTDFSTPGSNDSMVLIDTNNAITFTVEVKNLEVFEATAIFPTQNLINDHNDMELENLSAQLTEAKAESGLFIVDMYSTAQDSIYFEFDFPGMVRASDNDTFARKIVMDPATESAPSAIRIEFDLADYVFDLTGLRKDTVNSIGSEFRVYIDSSGQVTTLSKADSFHILYSFENITTSHVKGTFPIDTLAIGPDSSTFNFFDDLGSGSIAFSDVTASVKINNGFGIDAIIDLQELNSIANSQIVSLENNALMDTIYIESSQINDTIIPYSSELVIDKQNSNLLDFLNNQPDAIGFLGQVIINPNNNNGNHYAYGNSGINIDMEVTVPLNLRVEDLSLKDTLPFYQKIDPLSLEGILQVKYINTFPIELDLEIKASDSNYVTIDSFSLEPGLLSDTLVQYAAITLNAKQMENLAQSQYLIVNAIVNSSREDFPALSLEQFLDIQILIDAKMDL